MARQEVVIFEDDIDGTEGATPTTFALDGVQYEIDLSEKNAAKLAEALAVFVEHARKVKTGKLTVVRSGNQPRQGRFAESAGNGASLAQRRELNGLIRSWANGHVEGAVSERGRIPAEVVSAYDANDPTMIPGYQPPAPVVEVQAAKPVPKKNVRGVALNFTEGTTEVKTETIKPSPRRAKAAPKAIAG